MAQRRMFSQKIVASDAFLEMPTSSRELYFQLGMYADDDGFVNPKKIMRMVGASDDDIKILSGKRFVLPFENGVVVIKHWKINNLIRKDFYEETIYTEQKKQLLTKENKAYTECLQNVNNLSPQYSIGKDSIVQVSTVKEVATSRFAPPNLDEVKAYCTERANKVDAERFMDFYASKGWMVGKNKMKDWQACVRTWEKSEIKNTPKNQFGEITLYDGSKAVQKFGVWVDANNPNVKINLQYYPELT